MAKKTKTAKKNKSISKKSNKTNAFKKGTFKNSKTISNQRANNKINKLKKRKNQNVSSTIQNGTAVKFKDENLEFGKKTKSKAHEIRLGHVIDTNKNDEVAIAKRQHSTNGIKIGNQIYNPNFKTKDKNGNPLKIDNKILIRAPKKNEILHPKMLMK